MQKSLPDQETTVAPFSNGLGRANRARLVTALFLLAASTAAAQTTSIIPITPLTTVVKHPRSGYFGDPFPIPLVQFTTPRPFQLFSGTTKSILVCPAIINANCAEPDTLTLDPGPLAAQAAAVGATMTDSINQNIYLDRKGHWQMAATFFIKNPEVPHKGNWTVIVHAHPLNPLNPLAWVADTLLVGSFSKYAKANYDGKYVLDDDTLYLVYSRNLTLDPTHDGIVAQRMTSPTALFATAPVTLLEPAGGAGFNSELFFINSSTSRFKLVETGNITKIDGKYVMAYSTGDFQENDYKAGVAWSDTFLPSPGATYRKVVRPDPTAVWGKPGVEVQYLLQSEKPAWPNDVAGEVVAPGVPSIVQAFDGSWRLYFDGFAPDDHRFVTGSTVNFVADLRRPFFAPLEVNIPPGTTVSAATDAELATWLTPVIQ